MVWGKTVRGGPLSSRVSVPGCLSWIIPVIDHSTGIYTVSAVEDFKGARSFHYQDNCFNSPVMIATNC